MKTNRLSLILALTLGLSPAAFAQAKTFTGEIMDSPCAAMGSHEHMMKAERLETLANVASPVSRPVERSSCMTRLTI